MVKISPLSFLPPIENKRQVVSIKPIQAFPPIDQNIHFDVEEDFEQTSFPVASSK